MSDLIDRQAAIDTTWEEPHYTDPLNVLTEVRDRIKALPSAQPEIIRCKDCKHYNPDDRCYLQGAEADDFCSYAERRANDERRSNQLDINISADIGKAEHRDLWHYEQALSEIRDMLESAQPETYEDAVSREFIIEMLNGISGTAELDKAFAVVENAPSVTPKRKVAKWIVNRLPDDWVGTLYKCDQCGYVEDSHSKYCPNCGAYMGGGERDD